MVTTSTHSQMCGHRQFAEIAIIRFPGLNERNLYFCHKRSLSLLGNDRAKLGIRAGAGSHVVHM